MMNTLVVEQERRNDLNTKIEEDDDCWLDEFDNEWDEKQRLFDIEMKKKIKHCCEVMDRIILKNTIALKKYDDKIQEFVQIHTS